MNGKIILNGQLIKGPKIWDMCHDPSFFKAITIGDEYGLVLG